MATENSPQTLFRFVNVRNPNLAEPNKKNLRFIFRPEEVTGFFDTVDLQSGKTKLQSLLAAAETFALTSINNEKELQTGTLSMWFNIGKSAHTTGKISDDELSMAETEYQEISTDVQTLATLWDNLIYQYLTQRNFYVKETLVHILKGLHVGYVQNIAVDTEIAKTNGKNILENAIKAKMVLPNSIFRETTVSTQKSGTNTLSDRNKVQLELLLEQKRAVQSNTILVAGLQKLEDQIQTIEKAHHTSYQFAYDTAYADYIAKNAVNLSKYNEQLSLVKELEDQKASEADMAAAYQDLASFEVPPFEFQYSSELNWNDIIAKLTSDSLALFLEYCTDAPFQLQKDTNVELAKIEALSDEVLFIDSTEVRFLYKRYREVSEVIQQHSKTKNQEVLSKSKLSQQEYAKIGDVLLPVSGNVLPTSSAHLSYVLCAHKVGMYSNLGYVSLQVQVENASWNVLHAVAKADNNGSLLSENIGAVAVVDNQLSFPAFFVNGFSILANFEITIYFGNGQESTLKLKAVPENKSMVGILSVSNTNLQIGEVTVENRALFGVKRIGIAEYMKVVQTVHAYVPGEVSNIENVMASELRHKSVHEFTRTEETNTTSKTQEVEKISDTTKTDRSEMQTEVAKEI